MEEVEHSLESKLNPMMFKIDIEKYQEQAGSDLLTLYTIRVQHGEDEPWKVVRSFNEFESLHRKFVKLYREVPILPSRSIFTMNDQQKEVRQQQLEAYLCVDL